MELIYLWIENYKNIKNQEFNFNPSYEVHFDNENKKLSVEKTNKGIPDNFFGENITSITGIIGKNGSGKSNLLEFIFKKIKKPNFKVQNLEKKIEILKDINLEKNLKNIDEKNNLIREGESYIAILKKDNDLFLSINYFGNEQLTKESSGLKKIEDNEIFKYQIINYSSMLDYDYYRYNDILDGGFYEFNKDITTTFYYRNYQKNYSHLREDNKKIVEILDETIENLKNDKELPKKLGKLKEVLKDIDSKAKVIDYIKKLEVEKQINFYLKYRKANNLKSIIEEINVPEKILFSLLNPQFYMKENKISGKYLEILESNHKDIIFRNKIQLFFLVIQDKFKKRVEDVLGESYLKELEKERNNKEELNKKILSKLEKTMEEKFIELEFEIKEIKELFETFDGLFELQNYDSERDVFTIEVDEDKKNIFIKFLDLVLSLEGNIFNYSWDIGMSTGEKELFSFFSRIEESIKKEEAEISDKILLIDELGNSYHPEWQRKSIDLIIRFLNGYNKENNVNYKWQLILTSHSPFIMSDLPSKNMILLGKYEEKDELVKNNKQKIGNCKVESKKMKTFGSNIYDMLSDNFFMESTFGEFSRNKIKEVIKLLNGKRELSEKESSEIKFIIENIEEPLIKNRLISMLENYEENKLKVNKEYKLKKFLQENNIKNEDLKKYLDKIKGEKND